MSNTGVKAQAFLDFMLFTSPTLFEGVKVMRDKNESLAIEGKWASIRRLIKSLEEQGWKQKEKFPEVNEYKGERLTCVEMIRV